MTQVANGILTRQSNPARSNFPNSAVLSSSSLDILNWLLYVKYTKKEYNECKKLANDELERSNGYCEYANFILGDIYQEEGDIQQSLKYFKKCCELNPQNVENTKRLGRGLFLLGQFELAMETFYKAEKLVEIPDWNIYHHLGICYMKSKNEEKAKEYLKRAVELGRNERSFLELAKLYENQKDYATAVDIYEAALRLYPTSTELSVNLSLIFMHMDEFKRAFNQLGTTIAHDPTNPEALFTFAAEIQRHGEYDVAVIKYKIAADKLPECSELWNNIGMCFFGKRKYVAAITCLKRSFYLSPTNWLTLYNLGLLHLNTKQYASAALYLATAVKLNSQHGPAFTLLALALKHLKDDVNCRRCFEEALKRNSKDVEACLNYAVYLFLKNEKNSSAKYFAQFIELRDTGIHIDKELVQMGESLSKALETNLPLSEPTSHGQQITVEVELNQTDPLLENCEESNEIDEKSDFLTEPLVPSENNSDDEEDLV